LAILLYLICLTAVSLRWYDLGAVTVYGVLALGVLGAKMALSMLNRTHSSATLVTTGRDYGQAGAIITLYNEDPGYFRKCLESLLTQDYPLAQIIVVDDASTDTRALDIAYRYERERDNVIVVVHDHNQGKRHAMATGAGYLHPDIKAIVAVDSDTVAQPDAVRNSLRRFMDPEIQAITAVVLAENYETNILTRIIDVRYVNAFLTERAAYSTLGSVLCVCGSFALYRKSTFDRILDEFLHQRFMGSMAIAGDDRHLTNLCLRYGRVELAEDCVAQTVVPEKLTHYLRQQARWGRSFFRESLFGIKDLSAHSMAWWLIIIEIVQWILMTGLLISIVIRSLSAGTFQIGVYLMLVVVMAVAHSVRFFDIARQRQSTRSTIHSFALSPVYGLMTIAIMSFARVWSLLTVNSTAWGTRKKVEVGDGESPPMSIPLPNVALAAPAHDSATETIAVTGVITGSITTTPDEPSEPRHSPVFSWFRRSSKPKHALLPYSRDVIKRRPPSKPKRAITAKRHNAATIADPVEAWDLAA
jgi:hyaluronan synthase